MTVILTTPWAGHPAGATLTLPAYDEQALVRAGAAAWATPAPRRDEVAPRVAPVNKPARGGRRKG